MRGFLRTALAVSGLGVALSAASLFANEPCCSAEDASCSAPALLSECVEAACQAPCGGCTDCDVSVSCACEEYCRCCSGEPSLWNAYVGAIFLTRDRPDAGTIVGPNPPGGPAFSNGSNFDFNNQSGLDVLIARRLANGDQIEGRYFGVDDVNATQRFVSPGNFIGAGFVGPGGIPFVGTYTSQLKSAEINWRRPLGDRLTFLAGFRYLGFDESLYYTINTTTAAGYYEFQNDLYGGQIGGDLSLLDPCRPFQLHVIGKAGAYQNNFGGTFRTFVPVGNPTPLQTFGRSDSGSAFVGDLQLVASYQLTSHVAVRGGYQLLWLDNVALAGDNASVSQTNPALLNTRTDHDGHVFYQGAMIGVEVMW